MDFCWHECTIIYILLIFEQNGDFAPEQTTPSRLWNPKVHYRAHNSPPFVSTLSQINPVQAPPFHNFNVCLQIILPSRLNLTVGPFPQFSPSKYYMYVSSPPHVLHAPPLSFALI